MNEYMYAQNFELFNQTQVTYQPEMVYQKPEKIGVKELTKKETSSERTTRRKQATQREKRRMEKLNHCIEDIKQIVCPEMKVSQA